jgi:Tfp pilus assembly protein FimT
MSSARGSFRGGWSMIETLIVIALGGILSTMSISYMISAHPHAELERAEIEVSRALKEARSTAINHETQTRVRLLVDADQYYVEEYDREDDTWAVITPIYNLSAEVSFDADETNFADNKVVFTPRGTLVTGGTIGLLNSKSESSVLTGSVATGRFQLTGGNLR